MRSLDRRLPLPPFRADNQGRDVDRLVAEGLLRRVVLDVHAPTAATDTFSLRLAALRLVVPERVRRTGAVVCLETAAWLFAGGRPPVEIDIAVHRGMPRVKGRGLRIHQIDYEPADIWLPATAGVPVTSPARTAVDLAARLSLAEAVGMFVGLAAATGLRPEHVLEGLDPLSGRPGVARARAAVRAWLACGAGSVHPVAGHAVGVEHALDAPHRVDHVVEMPGRGHLEREARDGDAVA